MGLSLRGPREVRLSYMGELPNTVTNKHYNIIDFCRKSIKITDYNVFYIFLNHNGILSNSIILYFLIGHLLVPLGEVDLASQ